MPIYANKFYLEAQNKVVIESIRSYSMFGPTMYYLEDTSVQSSINAKLSILLKNNYQLVLSNDPLPIQIFTISDVLKIILRNLAAQTQVLGICLWRFMNMIQSVFYLDL